jgi:hypothetical protein
VRKDEMQLELQLAMIILRPSTPKAPADSSVAAFGVLGGKWESFTTIA